MKITNYTELQTKKEKLDFINDFIEYFEVSYGNRFNVYNSTHYNYTLKKTDFAVYLNFNSFHSGSKFFELHKEHHKSVDFNYKSILELIEKHCKEHFNNYLFNKVLAKYPEKSIKTKTNKI